MLELGEIEPGTPVLDGSDEASLIALSALLAQMIELYAPLTSAELALVAELTAAPYEPPTSQAACGAASGI